MVSLVLGVALLAAPLTGCNTSKVRVRLDGFANGTVDGLWFWRLENGSYRRICRIDLSNPYFSGGAEVVDYKQTCVDGRSASVPWQAEIKRLSNSQNVEITLTYRRAGQLTAHRASAFNQYGESALSSASVQL
jgi:hypothetical protein